MGILVREAVDLVFDGRAIAWPRTFDDAGEERRTIQRLTDDLVRARVGVRDPARQLARMLVCTPDEREHRHRIQITRLDAQPAVIDGLAVDTRRRASLETPLRQGQFPKAGCQRLGRRIGCAPGLIIIQPYMHLAIQEGARGEHDGLRPEPDAQLGDDAHHPVAFQQQVIHRLLEEGQIGLILQRLPNGLAIQDTVCLGARGSNRGAFTGIEDPELDASVIGGNSHDAAQRIDFLDKMSLANATNGRIARHLAQGVQIVA